MGSLTVLFGVLVVELLEYVERGLPLFSPPLLFSPLSFSPLSFSPPSLRATNPNPIANAESIADVWVDVDSDDAVADATELKENEEQGNPSSSAGPSTLYATKYDATDFFYRWLLPEELQPYFGLTRISLEGLEGTEAERLRAEGHTHAWPHMRLLPQGWKWSLHLGQRAHENMVNEPEALRQVEWVTHRAPAPRIRDHVVAGYIYVDDSSLLGVRRSFLNSLHEGYRRQTSISGMLEHTDKTHPGTPEELHLGFFLQGDIHMLMPKPQRAAALRKGLLFGSQRRKMLLSELEALIGHAVSNFLIMRLSLFLFRAVYSAIRWARKHDAKVVRVSRQMSLELAAASTTSCHISSWLASPPCATIVGSDSSDDIYCAGAREASEDQVWECWKYNETWRSSSAYAAPTTNTQRLAESEVAKTTALLRVWPEGGWKQRQLRSSLRTVRSTEFVRAVREGRWSAFSGNGVAKAVVGQPTVLPYSHLAVQLFQGSLGSRKAFWDLLSSDGELIFWAAHEGLDVLSPLSVFSDPVANVLNPDTCSAVCEILKEGIVGWLNVSVPLADWNDDLSLALANNIKKVVIAARLGKAEVILSGPWSSEFWNLVSTKEMPLECNVTAQRDLCCNGSPWGRSIRFQSTCSLFGSASLACPGKTHPDHVSHRSTRGFKRIGERAVCCNQLSHAFPVGTLRWLARLAAQSLCTRTSHDTNARKAFPPIPSDLIDQGWYAIWSAPWIHKDEMILMKEARASSYGFRWVIGHRRVFGKRLLILCDNMGVVYGLNKGRSANPGLLRIARRCLALSVFSRVRPRWRFLETWRNPCDLPTRPGKEGYAVLGVPGRSFGRQLVPGHLLLPTVCQRVCPPGLCQCE